MRGVELSELIAKVYEFGSDPERNLDSCISPIREAVSSNLTTLNLRTGLHDRLPNGGTDVEEQLVECDGLSMELTKEYQAQKLWKQRMQFERDDGVPILISNLKSSRNPLVAGPYAKYLVEKTGDIGWLSMKICTISGVDFVVTSTRRNPQGTFSEQDRALYAALAPHLAVALRMRTKASFKHSVARAQSDLVARLNLGVVILESRGHVVEANAIAKRVIEQDEWLFTFGQTLHAHSKTEDVKLQRLIRYNIEGRPETQTSERKYQAMCLSGKAGHSDLELIVEPLDVDMNSPLQLHKGVKLLFRQPTSQSTPSTERLRDFYGFTLAEANVAIKLCSGLSMDELCKDLGIRRNTVRAHLRSLFAKTNTSRQSEFVAKVLNGTGAIGDERKFLTDLVANTKVRIPGTRPTESAVHHADKPGLVW